MGRFRLMRWTLALVLVLAGSGHAADLAPYLQTIGLDRVRAADSPFKDYLGDGLGIAVFDTGIDSTTGNEHMAFEDGGVTRVRGGANFATDSPSPGPLFRDLNGHGTNVASMAAGRRVTLDADPDFDVSGIAPKADIYAVRVLNQGGGGSFVDIIDGLDWVIDQVQNHDSNIRVINMSLGTTSTFVTEPTGTIVDDFNARVTTLQSMGIPVFAASGNSGSQTGLSFPAIADGVISVGSASLSGTVSSFTNRNNQLDLLAPGEGIWGAVAGLPTTYESGSGTSFAAPLVSGSALVVSEAFEATFGRFPTVAELRDLLVNSSVTITEDELSFPQLDLYSSLAQATIPEPMTIALITPAAVLLLRRRRPLAA